MSGRGRGGWAPGRVAVLLGAVLLGVAAGCAAGDPPPPPPPDPLAAGNALLADGQFDRAVQAYGDALPEVESPERLARLRLLRAVARLEGGRVDQAELALVELQAVARDPEALVWRRVAAILVAEYNRAAVLQDAVLRAGVELHSAEQRLSALEEQLAQLGEHSAEQATRLAALRRECDELGAQLAAASDEAEAQRKQIEALEAELAALKDIDMNRKP